MRPAKRMGPQFLGLKNKISEIHIKQYQQNVRDSRELFDRKKMCRLAEYIQMTNKGREEERYIQDQKRHKKNVGKVKKLQHINNWAPRRRRERERENKKSGAGDGGGNGRQRIFEETLATNFPKHKRHQPINLRSLMNTMQNNYKESYTKEHPKKTVLKQRQLKINQQ